MHGLVHPKLRVSRAIGSSRLGGSQCMVVVVEAKDLKGSHGTPVLRNTPSSRDAKSCVFT